MAVLQVSEVIAAYREVTIFPNPTSASISINDNEKTILLQSKWSQRDLDRKEKISFLRSHIINSATGEVLGQFGPQEIKHELWNKTSPSGKLRAVVRQYKDKNNEDKQYLEIFDSTKKLKTIDIHSLEKHGKILENNGQFGSFEWSPSEKYLLYIAEKKKAKISSFLSSKYCKEGNCVDEENKIGDEFEYSETWGEQLTECVQPILCIFDVQRNEVNILNNLPSDDSFGQAIWSPDEAGIIVCAWKNVPYKLGLKFCCQRRSMLYFLDIQKQSYEILSEVGRAVRFPCFSPDMTKLIYFDVPEGGAHNQCARLLKIDWKTKQKQVVVDQVSYAPESEFPGIYMYDLARNIWFDDSIHLALATSWRSTSAVILINTDTCEVKRITLNATNKKDLGSFGLLGVQKNFLLLVHSALNQPFQLIIGKVSCPNNLETIEWIYPDGPIQILDWLTFSIIQHKPSCDSKHSKYESLDYESILCMPKVDSNILPPLIVFTHGGPNSVFDTSFNMITSFFCKCGYAVLMVNYRGSIGFGQDSILSLTGNIGVQDVQDVKGALLEISNKNLIDDKSIFKFGGSHGGFLTIHMIGQYPDTFRAAATRNPVVNLTSLVSTSDIPDWVFAQCGLAFNYSSVADDQILPHLWLRSPLAYINQIKTPVLLLIGLDDKRVPPSQGNELYKALKARGVNVKYLTYPGNNHSLSEVETETDCMINTIKWFNTHLLCNSRQ
nr:acylamino-acid-releasing enzyme-like isoform X2 [Biomphalaria glabrata]